MRDWRVDQPRLRPGVEYERALAEAELGWLQSIIADLRSGRVHWNSKQIKSKLKGARFVSTSETEEGKRMAEALVKALTGGDTVSARFLRGEFSPSGPRSSCGWPPITSR